MIKCPWFGKCGGCKFDFAADDYRASKLALLKDLPITDAAVWIAPGGRRRADFAFLDNRFGFFRAGSKDVVPIDFCPALDSDINKALPAIAAMPWQGAGAALVTKCENGIDVSASSAVPYFSPEFKKSAEAGPAVRVSWNGKVIQESSRPFVKFGDKIVDYLPGAFLQPSKAGEQALREIVVRAADGAARVADLFCGLGSFTFALNADGFDISGGGIHRDLFKNPLTVRNLEKYDCVVMDPPRAGALAQSRELAKSNVPKVIYVSCNPDTFMRDKAVLEKGGLAMTSLIPVDQFVGSSHWELVGVFERRGRF
jgi:23S rRNA (uracil1939-C5)-methyltransferase